MKVPEPSVFKNDSPIKTMIVKEDIIMIGTDAGDLKILDKRTFKVLKCEKISDCPILHIEQVLYAIVAQAKDVQGTITVLKVWKTAKGDYQIKRMMSIETKN